MGGSGDKIGVCKTVGNMKVFSNHGAGHEHIYIFSLYVASGVTTGKRIRSSRTS